jgi:glutathione S-transferase
MHRVEKVNMRCYGDKPEWFMRMQPSGGIPVAKIDGRVITESNDIMQVPILAPPAPSERAHARKCQICVLSLSLSLSLSACEHVYFCTHVSYLFVCIR